MSTRELNHPVHRLIPSRFPPVQLFDWAENQQELEEIAALEGLTNDRLIDEFGHIHLVPSDDWVGGPGSTALMAAFTHPGNSRFSDGTFGVYYAGDSLETAIAETRFHRERFLSASREAPCLIQMREYMASVQRPLFDMFNNKFQIFLTPDINSYKLSQEFAVKKRKENEWGLHYPSVRNKGGSCVAIFRPPALTIPIQGQHLDYLWDGNRISEVRLSTSLLADSA